MSFRKKQFSVQGVEKSNPNNFGGMCSRALPISRSKKDFDAGIDTIATTEAPALVVDWERWQVVREILPMKYCEMPDNDKVPFLDSHQRWELEDVKGSAKDFETEADKLVCKVYIAKSETSLRDKIAEGHIDSVSIGYMTDKNYTVEIPKGAVVTVDGTQYKNDFNDGYPMVVRTWWKTHELSGVAIGADEAAKFRSGNAMANRILEKRAGEINDELRNIKGLQGVSSRSQRYLQLIKTRIRAVKIGFNSISGNPK